MRIALFFVFVIGFIACKEEVEIPKQSEIQPILKIALIGDQMVLGKKVKNEENHTYPIQLKSLLGENFILETFAVKDATVLRKGNKPIWQDTLFQDAQDFQPDIVIIHLGWNDTKIRNWWRHGDEFVTNYEEIIDTFLALESQPKVILCRPTRIFDIVNGMNDSTLTIGVLPDIDSLGAWKNLELINLYEILAHRGDLFKEGVYPNKTACRIMAETIYDAVVNTY
ncbi:MAG: hypothetical protein ACJAUH_000039 [Saprospiraceae bacterium]|jgi:hypothetical protein|tara:strand:+ start:88 stop:762 length:675 start_codon:yes stop_codon:yes gene_type:complete